MSAAPVPIHPAAPRLRRAYADGAHGQVHYYDGGGAGAAMLLLHQSPASSSDFFALVPALVASGRRVLMMDTPGMGLSDALPFEPAIADYAAAVAAVLDAAGVASADLFGHHTGAQIAVEAAVRTPARVRSVALYGAPLMTADELRHWYDLIVPRERDGAVHRAQPGGSNLTMHFARIEAAFGTAAAQRMLLGALLAGPLWWHGHHAALRHDMGPALSAMTQPLLLVTHPGEMLDANTRAAARLRPDAALAVLDVESPMAADDAPGLLTAALLAFLDTI